jgi:hypothetical protein
MTLTNNEGGRRVTPSLSRLEVGRRSGRRERASGPAKSLPGTVAQISVPMFAYLPLKSILHNTS